MPAGLPAVSDVFGSSEEAQQGVVARVLEEGSDVEGVTDLRSVGSEFGVRRRGTRELLGYSFAILEPGLSLPISPVRMPDLAFCFGHLAWVLKGSSEVSEIRYYNPIGEAFSDDGDTLHGAVGPRLGYDRSILQAVVSQLRTDRTSRRAIIPLLYPADLLVSTRDFPCGLALQFFVREGVLWAVAFMRSQSVLMVLPYDIFLFRALQHIVAAELGIDPGPYIHLSASMHLYQDESARARAYITHEATALNMLPALAGLAGFDSVAFLEGMIREAVFRNDTVTIRSLISQHAQAPSSLWEEMTLCLFVEGGGHSSYGCRAREDRSHPSDARYFCPSEPTCLDFSNKNIKTTSYRTTPCNACHRAIRTSSCRQVHPCRAAGDRYRRGDNYGI